MKLRPGRLPSCRTGGNVVVARALLLALSSHHFSRTLQNPLNAWYNEQGKKCWALARRSTSRSCSSRVASSISARMLLGSMPFRHIRIIPLASPPPKFCQASGSHATRPKKGASCGTFGTQKLGRQAKLSAHGTFDVRAACMPGCFTCGRWI